MSVMHIWVIKGTVSLDNQSSFLRITIGSPGKVVVNYLFLFIWLK